MIVLSHISTCRIVTATCYEIISVVLRFCVPEPTHDCSAHAEKKKNKIDRATGTTLGYIVMTHGEYWFSNFHCSVEENREKNASSTFCSGAVDFYIAHIFAFPIANEYTTLPKSWDIFNLSTNSLNNYVGGVNLRKMYKRQQSLRITLNVLADYRMTLFVLFKRCINIFHSRDSREKLFIFFSRIHWELAAIHKHSVS